MPAKHAWAEPTGQDLAFSEPISHVVEALSRLRFGVIQLTVHDGRLTQLDVTERRRFPA